MPLMGRFFAALLIPYLLVFLVAAGSMQMAVDATTGEKEPDGGPPKKRTGRRKRTRGESGPEDTVE